MSVLLAKPYNQYQSYKAGEYITFNGSSNYYIALEDTGKQQSPTTANRKWQQVFNAGALTPSGVVAGTYGDATNVGQFTVDINGIVTNAVDVPITAGVPALTNTHIFVGNAGNVATDVAMSGDATVANTGALTIANNAVTYAKMQSVSTTSRLLGSSSTTTPVQEITLGTNLSLSGTTLNVTGGSGTVTSVNAGTNISVTGTATDPIINSLSDRYKTSSTTSNSVSNGSKSFTVDLNLSYIPLQEILVVYDAANHMHGAVTSYNSATGALVVDIKNHTGSGTYTSWVLNLDGTPVDALSGSGTINEIAYFTGAQILSSLAVATYPSLTQLAYVKGVTSPLQTQLGLKAPLASPALTGNPTAPTPTAGDNDTSIATTAFVTNALAGVSPVGSNLYLFYNLS